MTKLEELKASNDAAWDVAYYAAVDAARDAYHSELKKQKDNSNDHD